jgi:hypothetical protein
MVNKKPKKKGHYYCPECEKYYTYSECNEAFEFSIDGEFLESAWITCPKGHTWDDK